MHCPFHIFKWVRYHAPCIYNEIPDVLKPAFKPPNTRQCDNATKKKERGGWREGVSSNKRFPSRVLRFGAVDFSIAIVSAEWGDKGECFSSQWLWIGLKFPLFWKKRLPRCPPSPRGPCLARKGTLVAGCRKTSHPPLLPSQLSTMRLTFTLCPAINGNMQTDNSYCQ